MSRVKLIDWLEARSAHYREESRQLFIRADEVRRRLTVSRDPVADGALYDDLRAEAEAAYAAAAVLLGEAGLLKHGTAKRGGRESKTAVKAGH
jgi:hypothetical protein